MLVANYYCVSTESLHVVKRAKGNIPRAIAIYLAAELSTLKFQLIADFFKNISVTGISQIIFRTNKLKINTSTINKDIVNLSNLIKNSLN